MASNRSRERQGRKRKERAGRQNSIDSNAMTSSDATSRSSDRSRSRSPRNKSRSNKLSRHRKHHNASSRISSRISISRLTDSVTKDHILEIFSPYGRITSLDVLPDKTRTGSHLAAVEYETTAEAAKAVKYMNGGMIDKHEIVVEAVKAVKSKKHK